MSHIKVWFKTIYKKISLVYKVKIKPVINKSMLFLAKYLGLNWLLKKYQSLKHATRNAITGILFISPWLLGLYLFGLRPFASSLRMSFADSALYVINSETQTVDFIVRGWTIRHFTSLIQNQPEHVGTVINVFLDIALIVPLVMIFALLLALMLNQPLKGKGIFRVIFFIPVILLSGNMLSYFNQYNLLSVPAIQSGAIAQGINAYLPRQFSILITGVFERIVLILWLSGVQMLIFLAGLQKNDRAIYEAAAIDGASVWDSFWKITLPGLHSLMIINIIYTTVIYANLSNNALIGLINQTLVDVRFGRAYSSALSWVLFVIQLLIIGIYTLMIKLSNRRYE
ncbi:carbohydrate ABC transporter permease [Peloplasma aerotolerans]|uniref:Sugar ABC transporter permease n=1 Tax=Peloplasma aerotolerans TaxID=3044389 RepID=A0AAW6U462_9MOLU|nr:sugar ABC transporter permease [Mariniplasma sp. M4Ah]MDI6452768.1 sugar ABC transporter permease [Mariniplasma sp. M4Ah]